MAQQLKTRTAPRTEHVQPIQDITHRLRPAPPATYRIETAGHGTLSIDIDADQDPQQVANTRQQRITKHQNSRTVKTYTPEPPTATLLFIENRDGTKELINTITETSPDFVEKCENFADNHQKHLVIHYPKETYNSRYIPPMNPEQRQRYRDKPPTMTPCPRCKSISCGFSTTKASPSCRPAETETPATPQKLDPIEIDKDATVQTKTPRMNHSTTAWRKSALLRQINNGADFESAVANTGINRDAALKIYLELVAE